MRSCWLTRAKLAALRTWYSTQWPFLFTFSKGIHCVIAKLIVVSLVASKTTQPLYSLVFAEGSSLFYGLRAVIENFMLDGESQITDAILLDKARLITCSHLFIPLLTDCKLRVWLVCLALIFSSETHKVIK